MPGIGPVTATTFVATLDDFARFGGAKETRAYLGAAAVALRRGSRVATATLARKLAGILFAMWRDGTYFAGGAAAHVELAAA